ncbi:DNA helicase B [Anopheles sinensis]|uniref:DNA helicase B n=1 Tax=Anopheles sinensis TaxID=74873 RepID=A0A084WCR9_ANOSI|nr:DNA helicase B [Anopheles sinensis]
MEPADVLGSGDTGGGEPVIQAQEEPFKVGGVHDWRGKARLCEGEIAWRRCNGGDVVDERRGRLAFSDVRGGLRRSP